jgi:hypothetical protein
MHALLCDVGWQVLLGQLERSTGWTKGPVWTTARLSCAYFK